METHASGFRLRANAPKGQKRFPISRMKKMPAITFLSVLAILFFGFELCPAQTEGAGLLVHCILEIGYEVAMIAQWHPNVLC